MSEDVWSAIHDCARRISPVTSYSGLKTTVSAHSSGKLRGGTVTCLQTPGSKESHKPRKSFHVFKPPSGKIPKVTRSITFWDASQFRHALVDTAMEESECAMKQCDSGDQGEVDMKGNK